MLLTRWEYTLAIIFAIISAILVFLVVLQVRYVDDHQKQIFQDVKNVKSAGFMLQDIPNSPLSESNIEEYAEMAERPLFFKDRRPIVIEDAEAAAAAAAKKKPVPVVEKKPEVKELTLRLIGIINIPNSIYALFQDPQFKPGEEKFKRFKQGEDINGWKLKEIKPDRVIISSGKKTEEVLLAKPRKQQPTKSKRKTKTSRRKTPRKNPFKRNIKK